jgi:hypothetical protein
MPAWKVVHAGEVEFIQSEHEIASGLSNALLVVTASGAVHLEVALLVCSLGQRWVPISTHSRSLSTFSRANPFSRSPTSPTR